MRGIGSEEPEEPEEQTGGGGLHLSAVLLDEVLVRGAVVVGLNLVAVVVGWTEKERQSDRQTDRRGNPAPDRARAQWGGRLTGQKGVEVLNQAVPGLGAGRREGDLQLVSFGPDHHPCGGEPQHGSHRPVRTSAHRPASSHVGGADVSQHHQPCQYLACESKGGKPVARGPSTAAQAC